MNDQSVPSSKQIRSDWIPRDRYQGEQIASDEQEFLWPYAWQIACRESDLVDVGDYVTVEIADDSIVVMRNGSGPDDFYAAYNVCQHRGRRLLLEEKANAGARILCKYHGWQYDTSGRLVHVPFEGDFAGCPGFSKEKLGLSRIRWARWGGWIWINQDENCESLEDFLGVIPRMIDPFEPESMRPVWYKTLIAPVNWKTIMEAFNESYHAIPTHNSNMIYNMHAPTATYGKHGHYWFVQLAEGMEGASTAATRYRGSNGKWTTAKSIAETIWAAHKVLDDMLFAMTLEPTMDAALRLRGEMEKETDPFKVMQRFWELQQEELARRGVKWPENLTPEAIEKAGVSWHIFPNSIVLPTVDGALWYRFRPYPGDASRCFVDLWSFGRFAPGEEPQIEHQIYDGFEEFAGQNPFLEEDFPNVRLAEAGMKSRGWKGATINPVQEGLVSHFHMTLAEFIEENRRKG